MPWNYNALTSLDKSNKCKENSHAIKNQILWMLLNKDDDFKADDFKADYLNWRQK